MNNKEISNKNRDYTFFINWQDRRGTFHCIGALARIDKNFYIWTRKLEEVKEACKSGYIGFQGFEPGMLLVSTEMFEEIKNRVTLDKRENDVICEELAIKNGISMTDSFSVQEVPIDHIFKDKDDDEKEKTLKEKILEIYKSQRKENDIELQ